MGEILQAMRLLVVFANRTKEVRDLTEGLRSVVAFEIKDDDPFYVVIESGELRLVEGQPDEPDATIKSDVATMRRVLKGEVTQEEAFDKKKIRPEGSITDAMRFRYIVNLVLEKSKTLRLLRKMSFVMG